MEARTDPTVTSYNILAEVVGAVNPEEIVLLGGHSDSWDVGQGAIDDGGGIFSAWEAVRQINSLILSNQLPRPKRTIRLIFWVDEEIGQQGAQQYVTTHWNEIPNHVIAMESDIGNFQPIGFGFSGTIDAFEIMEEIGAVLLAPIGSGNMTYGDGADTDNGFLVDQGVPGGSLDSTGATSGDDAFYFNYHHSNADTITHMNYEGVKLSVASFGIVAYVLADMDQRLPHAAGSDDE